MKVLLQRVLRAEVRAGGRCVGRIGQGVLIFLGIERADDDAAAEWYARRVPVLKLFPGAEGEPWRQTLVEAGGAALVVSQFTLPARTRKGRRPSFDPAAPPERAIPLYNHFVTVLRDAGVVVEEGEFGAKMEVELVNDGPVTFLLEGPA